MKKLFVIAVALLSVSAFAEEPRAVMTEMSSRGDVMLTRTLTDKGVLTETVCKMQSQGVAEVRNCVSQTMKLSKQQTLDTAKDMRSNQMALLASAPTEGYSAQKGSSSSSERMASMHAVKAEAVMSEKSISRTSSNTRYLNEQKSASNFVIGQTSPTN